MPRTMRVEYPGAIYHVMYRGDRREDIVSAAQQVDCRALANGHLKKPQAYVAPLDTGTWEVG